MKKNIYLLIFIAVAVVICGMVFMVSRNVLNRNGGSNSSLINSNSQLKNKNNQPIEQEKMDLTKENIDFEDDADDLADGFVDDSQFDESSSFDSVENEVY